MGTHSPSIPSVAFLSTSHLLQQLISFSSPTDPPPYVQITSKHSRNTSSPSHLFTSQSVHTRYVSVTSSPLHLISSFPLLPYSIFPPHMQLTQLLFHTTFSLQLNTFIPPQNKKKQQQSIYFRK